MAANTSPIFPLSAQIGFASITAANTATDGTGTSNLIFTAAANGSRLDKIRITSLGTNVATKVMIFINNGSTQGTAANNALYKEFTIASTTASNTAALVDTEFSSDLVMPSGYRIYTHIATAVAAGLKITAFGGDY